MTPGVMLPLINNLLYNASIYKKFHHDQFTNDCVSKNLAKIPKGRKEFFL